MVSDRNIWVRPYLYFDKPKVRPDAYPIFPNRPLVTHEIPWLVRHCAIYFYDNFVCFWFLIDIYNIYIYNILYSFFLDFPLLDSNLDASMDALLESLRNRLIEVGSKSKRTGPSGVLYRMFHFRNAQRNINHRHHG